MSDTVLIVLIIAIVVVLYMFRRQLKSFFIKADKSGIKAKLETRESDTTVGRGADVNISGSRQIGKGNVIEVGRSNVNVEDTTQLGQDQKIVAKSDNSSSKKKQ